MKIRFDTSDYERNVDKRTTEKKDVPVQKTGNRNGYKVDISGKVMDNSAYTGQGKTAEEIMQNAEQQKDEIALQRNYMAVMSNCMSEEDFAKLQEEGFSPGSTKIEEVVTIVDKIKASLLQAGVSVKGYTDTVDKDTLAEITGSETFAKALSDAFEEQGIPLTEQTAQNAVQAWEEAGALKELSEGASKYMVQNEKEPTAENLYLAQFSASEKGSRKQKGYYQDEAGYYAKKAGEINWEALKPQMEKIIEKAGLSEEKNAEEYAKWLVERGIPLTERKLKDFVRLQKIILPKTEQEMAKAIAGAVSDGKNPKEADMVDGRSLWEQAADIWEKVNHISGEAVDRAAEMAEGQEISLKRLYMVQERMDKGSLKNLEEEPLIHVSARRTLEEVRLQMTIEANRELLKSGYAIDTAPLEELVEALKNIEEEKSRQLFSGESIEEGIKRAGLYENTLKILEKIPTLPISVVGKTGFIKENFTLTKISEEGTALKAAYEKAATEYETLMTEPRKDLGDSIKKAFRNIDELLNRLELETSQANQRAVRILGYNSMEITEENIDRVKAADQALRNVIQKLTPAATLTMIRDGKNPLTMNVEEMDDYLSGQERGNDRETEKYSRFLYKLEQKKEISQEEKDAYMGIYRLIRQVEKSDGAALGSLLKQGSELSFQNLLTAVRTIKNNGISVSVDDAFGTLEAMQEKGVSITDQIKGAFAKGNRQKEGNRDREKSDKEKYDTGLIREIYHNLDKEILISEDKAKQAWQKEQLSQIRKLHDVEDQVFQMLDALDEPVTVDSILAAKGFLKSTSDMWRRVDESAKRYGERRAVKESSKEDSLKAWERALDTLEESFTDKESALTAWDALTESAKDIVEEDTFERETIDSISVKEMGLLYKQVSFTARLAKEEEYEIPVRTESGITAMRLKIIRSEEEKGRIEASFEDETAGKITAGIEVEQQEIKGFLVYSKETGKEKITQALSELKLQLSRMGFQAENISAIQGESLRMEKQELSFLKKGNEETDISTKELYQIAKALITTVKKIPDKEGVLL